MKNKIYYLTVLLFFVLATGCDDANNNPGTYSNGVFVINEGAFGSSNSELSFIHADNSVNNNLYANNNSSAILGDVFQSMTIAGSSAYLVINNSNKIVVVDLNNLQSQATISGLNQPRYMVTYGGKGYVSVWNGSGNGNVMVIDLSTNTIIDSVQVGVQPDAVMMVGNKVLVANSGDSTLHLINTTTLTITNIGDIDYPKYITQTNDGNIWVLYTGKPAWSGTQTDGGLLVLNSTATAIVKDINIGSTAFNNPTQLTTDGNSLFYEYLGNVYKIDKSATSAPTTPFLIAPATYLYGMNYYAANNTLYVADAKNFATSGVAKRYNATTGALLDTLNVGIAPNGFLFN